MHTIQEEQKAFNQYDEVTNILAANPVPATHSIDDVVYHFRNQMGFDLHQLNRGDRALGDIFVCFAYKDILFDIIYKDNKWNLSGTFKYETLDNNELYLTQGDRP